MIKTLRQKGIAGVIRRTFSEGTGGVQNEVAKQKMEFEELKK
jgi:hypothetical protein